MTREEIKSQLQALIDDRKSFLNRVKEENYIYERDIEALEYMDNTAHWDIACGSYTPFCSRCGKEPPAYEMTAFCPHCGAKMATRERGT